MVDFNSDGTISKPPKEVVQLIIIEKLYNYLEADEHFIKQRLQGAPLPVAVPRSRLRSLFLVCYSMIKRRLDPESYAVLEKVCIKTDEKVEPSDLLEAFSIMSDLLDTLQLTKLDTKPVFQRHKIEEANKVHGY